MSGKVIFIFKFYYVLLKTIIACNVVPKRDKAKNTILFLENFPIENAGYQYRAAKWVPYLEAEGFKVDVWTIVESKAEFDHYQKHNHIGFMILSMRKRFRQILKSRHYGTVIVRRELLLYNDYGNLFMEKFLVKIHPNAILDFDDDIAAAKKQPRHITNFYGKLLQEHGDKFNASLRLYKHFIVGSNYLKQLVLERSQATQPENICIIPTCVDYDKFTPKLYDKKNKVLTLGWIGGTQNYFLLDKLMPVLNELAQVFCFKLLVIGGESYKRDTKFDIEFVPWALNSEIENLKKIDIGLMPLNNDTRSKGKCGFKLIQYMGLGITSIASSITVNREIVDDEIDSFLVSSEDSWYIILNKILNEQVNLQGMGNNARKKINKNYTFKSNVNSYIAFLNL